MLPLQGVAPMDSKNLRFRDLPRIAKNYILMHTLGSPFMIGEYALIMYLFLTGYVILQIGILFTIVNIIVAIGPFIVGKLIDHALGAKITMAIIYILESVGYFVLFFAIGPYASAILLLGITIQKFETIFYPIFHIYEHYAFPEDIRERAFLYHIIVPEYVQIVAFPALGFVLTYVFSSVEAYRYLFLVLSIGDLLMVVYVLRRIDEIKKATFVVEHEKKKFKLPKGFTSIFSIEIGLILAESLIPTIVLAYFVLIVLKETFVVLMLLEVTNSAVTILLGNFVKNKETNSRGWLVKGVFLFIAAQTMFILAAHVNSIIPVFAAIVFLTAGNVLWFPVHNSLLYRTIPEEKRGTFFGSMSTIERIIGLFIPFISALLVTVYIYLPFMVSMVLYTVCIIGYIKITRQTSQPV